MSGGFPVSGAGGAGRAASREWTPTLRRAGEAAVLLDCSTHPDGGLAGALRLAAALRAARESDMVRFDELVPAAQTVLVRGGVAGCPADLRAALMDSELVEPGLGNSEARSVAQPGPEISEQPDSGSDEQRARATVIPVVYDGQDLAEVARLTGLSPDKIIAAHTEPEYTVAFTGFAPGFAYLSGGDPRLDVPRRSTPRTRIPAGSVGLAGQFSGVYPRESPGGWQLIGHTDHPMWDLDREHPATLVPGGTVRFESVREQVQASREQLGFGTESGKNVPKPTPSMNETDSDSPEPAVGRPGSAQTTSQPVLRVTDPGLLTLIQDLGRPGLADLGVSASGAADVPSLLEANRLVGNASGSDRSGGAALTEGPPGGAAAANHSPAAVSEAACLEIGIGGFSADVLATTVMALAGAPRSIRIDGPFGTRLPEVGLAFRVDPGERIVLGPPTRGLRTMLAVRGGIGTGPTLGSRSSDTLAGLGPASPAVGDVLVGEAAAGLRPISPSDPSRPSESAFPAVGETTVLHVVPGPRDDWFGADGLDHFLTTEWEVSPRSDRVGVRLTGTAVPRSPEYAEAELPSEALVPGALQVPADGQPVLFLADYPLTGGYPVIGVVEQRDLAMAAQLPPGALVRFALASAAQPATTSKETRS